MRCYIACLPDEAVSAAISARVSDICQQFQLQYLAKKNRMPHMTIKSPFEIWGRSIQDLEALLAQIAAEQYTLLDFEITGFGNFDEVVYATVQPSQAVKDLHRLVLERVSRFPGVTLSQYDPVETKTYHMTLGKNSELENQKELILWHLEQTPLKMTGRVDALAIMEKKSAGVTQLFRKYTVRS